MKIDKDGPAWFFIQWNNNRPWNKGLKIFVCSPWVLSGCLQKVLSIFFIVLVMLSLHVLNGSLWSSIFNPIELIKWIVILLRSLRYFISFQTLNKPLVTSIAPFSYPKLITQLYFRRNMYFLNGLDGLRLKSCREGGKLRKIQCENR